MILGLGLDIVQIPRIERLYKDFGLKFVRRILSEDEIARMPNKEIPYYLAKRFAAKEAFSKAMGFGIGSRVTFKTIEICKDSAGKPYFSDATLALLGEKKIIAHLSIADDYPTAIAQVILSRAE